MGRSLRTAAAAATLSSLGRPDAHRAAALRAVFSLTLAFADAHVSGRPQAWQALIAGSGGALSGLVKVTPFGSVRGPGPPRGREKGSSSKKTPGQARSHKTAWAAR
jgi:hypothetical protein